MLRPQVPRKAFGGRSVGRSAEGTRGFRDRCEHPRGSLKLQQAHHPKATCTVLDVLTVREVVGRDDMLRGQGRSAPSRVGGRRNSVSDRHLLQWRGVVPRALSTWSRNLLHYQGKRCLRSRDSIRREDLHGVGARRNLQRRRSWRRCTALSAASESGKQQRIDPQDRSPSRFPCLPPQGQEAQAEKWTGSAKRNAESICLSVGRTDSDGEVCGRAVGDGERWRCEGACGMRRKTAAVQSEGAGVAGNRGEHQVVIRCLSGFDGSRAASIRWRSHRECRLTRRAGEADCLG
jgi:hypothetical protein